MTVYNINPFIRSTVSDCKQFAVHLRIDDFLKEPASIKGCSNKYKNS